MTLFNLGRVVGEDGSPGAKGDTGDDGAAIWTTSTAPTHENTKYTFTISNLNGRAGLTIAVSDLIFYDAYYYIVDTVNSTTVECTTRVSIKGSDSVTIVDNLTSDSSTSALSAKQGKVLNTSKLNISQTSYKGKNVVVDSSTGNITFENKPIIPSSLADLSDGSLVYNNNKVSYNMGELATLSDIPSLTNYVQKSSTSGLLKNDGTVDTNTYLTSSAISGMLTTSDVKDNLTSTDTDKPLSAKQGKVLKDLIGDAITYINQ